MTTSRVSTITLDTAVTTERQNYSQDIKRGAPLDAPRFVFPGLGLLTLTFGEGVFSPPCVTQL